MSDHVDAAERTDPKLATDPVDRTEAAEPIEPIDRNDPTDPIESTDPFGAMDSTESSDHSDQREPRSVVLIVPALRRCQRACATVYPWTLTHSPDRADSTIASKISALRTASRIVAP